ncbi:MAG: T9SS type A sorting domain-containing protein, partial [Bacteroidota bacterium]
TDARFGDSGIASLELGEAAANVRLDVTPFDAGADAVDFSVLLANPTQMGRGYLVARDVAGNADSVLVELDAPSEPIQDLTIDVTYTFDTATSGTITATVRNLGTVAMNNVRVKRTQRLNVSIAPNQVDLGPVEPGGSTDAVFSFSAVREDAFAKFRVQDRSTRVRDEDDPANNTAEAFLVVPGPAQSTAPDLAADQTASPLDDEREVDARDDAAPTDEASRDEHANASAATREAGLQQSGPSSPDQARERAGASDAPSVDLALSVHYAFEDEASGRLVATVENIGSRQAHRVRVKRAYGEGVKLEAKAAAAASLAPGATSTFEFAFSERRPGARIALSAEEGGLRGIEPVRWNNTVDVALRQDAAGVEFGPRVPENVAREERLSSTSAEPEPAAASVSVPPPAPEEGLALSAYPNPASDVTTLRFYLDEPGPVQVVLYDLTGRTILRVHEGALDAGWHRIPLDASPLAGGTYVWQVATSRRSSSGNVTVVR